MVKLYALVHPSSKYADQCDGNEFEIRFVGGAEHCWQGNENSYRTSDLVFFYRDDKRRFRPAGIVRHDLLMLERICAEWIERFRKAQSGGFLERDAAYQDGQSPAFELMRELLELVPRTEPTCGQCGKTARFCECDG